MHINKFVVLGVVVVLGGGWCLKAQAPSSAWKKQVFAGSSVSTPWADGSRSVSAVAGFALIKPLGRSFIFKGAVSGGSVTSVATGNSYPTAQAAGVIGWKPTQRFMVGGGGGLTMLSPQDKKSVKLPTGIVFTATKLSKHFSLITPITFHERGYSMGAQIAYTW
jgi:hypothetical protein